MGQLNWRNCYFVISGRIAVIAGENRGWAQHTEVIDLTNSSLEYDLLPDVSERFGSVGGLLMGQPLICGGYNCYDNEYLQNCIKLGHSETKFDLTEKRCGAASVVLDQKTLWVTGGEDGNDDLLTTEFISLHHSPIKGPDLPFTIERHGLVYFNEKSIYMIGGFQDRKISNRTWIINLSEGFSIKEGPPMNVANHPRLI